MKETLSILAKVRDHYLSNYESALAEYLKQYRPSGPEVLLELPRPERALAFRLYRADMASNVNGQPSMSEVNPNTHLSFQPFRDRTKLGLAFQMHPIVWNGVEFDFAGEIVDTTPIEKWCISWLDVDEVGPKNEVGLLGAIHSVTPPRTVDGRVHFSVDFGSASLQAFVELLDVLRTMGASDVDISSSVLAET
jgi:hypothetical protein